MNKNNIPGLHVIINIFREVYFIPFVLLKKDIFVYLHTSTMRGKIRVALSSRRDLVKKVKSRLAMEGKD